MSDSCSGRTYCPQHSKVTHYGGGELDGALFWGGSGAFRLELLSLLYDRFRPPGARQLDCVLIVIACYCDMAWGDVGSNKLLGELLSMLIAGKPGNWQQRNKPQKKESSKPKRGEFGD
eukprot:2404192-Amphidinium_carterae.1